MADRIKGITIEIGGDTTGLSKALKGVNGEIRDTQTQLKDVNRLLKLDPSNTELLEQKQKLLADAINETKTKLDVLKEAEKQVQEQFEKGETSQKQYQALQREIAQTELDLKDLEEQAGRSRSALEKVASGAQSVADGAYGFASKTRGISLAAGGAIAGMFGLGMNAASNADELSTLSKQTGFSTEELQKFKYAAELVDVPLDTITGAAKRMTKTLGSSEGKFEALGIATRDLNGELLPTNEIFYNTLAALGEIPNETERDIIAMDLFGKSAQELAGITDDGGEALRNFGEEAENLGLIMDEETISKLNDANDQFDKLKAQASADFAELGASVLEALLPLLEDLMPYLREILDWFGNLSPKQAELILFILGAIALMSPLASAIGAVSSAISFITTTVIPNLGKALSWLLVPPHGIIILIIAAIVGLVALVVAKGDEMIASFQKVDDWFENVMAVDWREHFGPVLGGYLNNTVEGVQQLWEGIKTILTGLIDFIKGVFTGDWERAWKGLKEIFAGVWYFIADIVELVVNGIIGIINGLISAINTLIRGLNKIHVDVPNWIPGIGGKSFGFNIKEIGKINYVSLPRFADGGVLTQGSAIVGEAGAELLTVNNGRAIVQPLTASVDTKAITSAIAAGQSPITVNVAFTGSLSQLGRLLEPVVSAESTRRGGNLIKA